MIMVIVPIDLNIHSVICNNKGLFGCTCEEQKRQIYLRCSVR